MNNEMAYLLGLISGNGDIQRGNTETNITIEIPHKKMKTEFEDDVRIYVKASIIDIKEILVPLLGTSMTFTQNPNISFLSFRKPNEDYLIREILRYVGNATSHENIRISPEVFDFTYDEKIQFIKGFADVTGYIRRSNYFFDKEMHRVYIEIPHNWKLVSDFCNLLRSVDIPVQNIDWAHPNMRDGNLIKYNQGKTDFWKKEHQVKIYANEFEKVGFAVLHKKEALDEFSNELVAFIEMQGKKASDVTHRYYWELSGRKKKKPYHPGIHDPIIPEKIRGKNYNSWKDIAFDLGYLEEKSDA